MECDHCFSALYQGQEVSLKLCVPTLAELRFLLSETFPSFIAEDVTLVGRKFAHVTEFAVDTALISDEVVSAFFKEALHGALVVEARDLFPGRRSLGANANPDLPTEGFHSGRAHAKPEIAATESQFESFAKSADSTPMHALDAVILGAREHKENLLRMLRPHRRTLDSDELSLTDCSDRMASQNQASARKLSHLAPVGAMEELEHRVSHQIGDHRDVTGIGERHTFALSNELKICELLEAEASGHLGANPVVVSWEVAGAYRRVLKQGQVVSRGQLPLPRKALVESPVIETNKDIGQFVFRLLPAGDAASTPDMATIFIWRNHSEVQMTFGISFSDGQLNIPSSPRLWLQGRCWYRMDVPWNSIAEVVMTTGRLTITMHVLHWRLSTEIDFAMGARSARSMAERSSEHSFGHGSLSPREDTSGRNRGFCHSSVERRSLSPALRSSLWELANESTSTLGSDLTYFPPGRHPTFDSPLSPSRATYLGIEYASAADSKQARSKLTGEPHLRPCPSPPSMSKLF